MPTRIAQSAIRSRCVFVLQALAILVLVASTAAPAFAQELEINRQATELELEQLREQITLGEVLRVELAQEIADLDKDRLSINRSLIEASRNTRSLEKRIDRAGIRLSQLRDEQEEVRAFLRTKQSLLSEVLAALQRMGRKPPPALLVLPEDALSSVRSAILLGSVVPEVRAETDILLTQLRELSRIGDQIMQQRDSLKTDLVDLLGEEQRLNLLLEEKRQLAGLVQEKMAEEQARAAELAAKANSLDELISGLETEIASVQEAAEAARRADAERKARNVQVPSYEKVDAFADHGRTAPAIDFVAAKGLLPLPVYGAQQFGFGDEDEFGDAMSGLSLEAPAEARVISPADGWILYAGPFRTYGTLLIIDAGNDYHVVLAGMESVNVTPGQFIIVGEPIGKMGSKQFASAGSIDVSTTKPTLYVEFRKNGIPIDPTPWWSDPNIQKVADGS